MSTSDRFKAYISQLTADCGALISSLEPAPDAATFARSYQAWYTPALRLVEQLAPDRLAEFKSYHEVRPEPNIDYYEHLWGIREFLLAGVRSGSGAERARVLLSNQLAIVSSLDTRVEGFAADARTQFLTDLQTAELSTAGALVSVSLRGAGAVAGVVLESHLQAVSNAHNVPVSGSPSISELNDALRNARVIDLPTWRRIQHLGDLRNLSVHKKDRDPSEQEVNDLISGVSWAVAFVQ